MRIEMSSSLHVNC